jgi:hypothetical protein
MLTLNQNELDTGDFETGAKRPPRLDTVLAPARGAKGRIEKRQASLWALWATAPEECLASTVTDHVMGGGSEQ